MALRVWLPFIGSTVDQGCYDLKAPTYTNMTVDQAGKIGSCEKGASIFHLQQDDVVEGDDWTIAGWTKCEETAPTTWYVLSKNSTAGFGTSTDCALAISRSAALWGCVGGIQVKASYAFTTGSWYHVALTATPGQYKFYVNGVCIGSGSQANTRVTGSCLNICVGGRSSNAAGTALYNIANQENIRSNDIRLYDHCLSVREIQEIAKGLIVHFPFNDSATVSNNKIYDCSGYGHHATPGTTALTLDSVSPRYTRCLKNTSAYPLSTNVEISQVDQMTVAGWVNIGTWGNQVSGLWAFDTASVPSSYLSSSCHHRDSKFDMRGTNGTYYNLTCNDSDIPVNTWKHVVFRHDGVSASLFIDGTLKRSVACPTPLVGFSNIWLGYSRAGGLSRQCQGSWSDFRVYMTALSDDQVKELYNNPISVCKSGNLMCMEVVEP